jgi:hypothetical protein
LIEVMAILQNNDNGDLAELALPANDDAMTWDQAKASPYWPQFQEAMKEELRSLEGNGTSEVVDKPTHQHTLTGRWVFKLKCDADGKIIRYKARWVVQGYKQAHRADYDETWAGVVRATSVRALLARAATKGYYVSQMDVITAFLHGALDKEVYVELPHGFQQGEKVCRLRKALYGLKQAPKIWYEIIRNFLLKLGFVQNEADESVFIHEGKELCITVYVDDLDMKNVNWLKEQLAAKFDMKDLGEVHHCLRTSKRRRQ